MLLGCSFLKLQKSAIYETLQSTQYSVVEFARTIERFVYLFHIKLSLYFSDIIEFLGILQNWFQERLKRFEGLVIIY